MYMSYRESIAELSTEEKGILLDAIFDYHSTGNIPDMPKMVRIVFSIMKHQFDRDCSKYQEIVERNRMNGMKGGRPQKTQKNPKNPDGYFGNPVKNSGNPNDDDNDDGNGNDTEHGYDDGDVTEVGAGFAEIANFYESSSSSFPKVDLNDNSLRNQYGVMLKKHGVEKIKEAILRASESWYCTGHNDRASVVPLLWILTPKYFDGLLSKKFENRGKFPEFDKNGMRVTDNQKNSIAITQSLFAERYNENNTPY